MTFQPLAITCMYARPKVSELFLTNMDRIGLPVLAAISDAETEKVCKGKCDYFYYQNQPLGDKFNEVIRRSLKYKNWSHLIITGDDDLYSDNFLELCEEFQDHPFLGIRKHYMVDTQSSLACLFQYPESPGLVLGGGRCLHRNLVGYLSQSGGLYYPPHEKSLDHYADLRLMEQGHYPFAIDKDQVLCTAIKSGQNIWDFNNFRSLENTTISKYEDAVEILTKREKRLLDGIRNQRSTYGTGSESL